MENNAFAKFFQHENCRTCNSKSIIVRFMHFSIVLPYLILLFKVFYVNSYLNELLFPN